jgi:hypothetical protein
MQDTSVWKINLWYLTPYPHLKAPLQFLPPCSRMKSRGPRFSELGEENS